MFNIVDIKDKQRYKISQLYSQTYPLDQEGAIPVVQFKE
jgi:hypothetical protein